ncbi:MAG: tRNA (adenosine(37)-N6)-dimethylallyltransferase MiaA [Ilumatobacteraceae bacterium]
MDTSQPIVVLGPTASGKSDVAMAIAAADPTVELVAADSMQVYREMDIGTAKPSAHDRARVRHHCIDLVDPSEDFTVTRFAEAAEDALASITARGGRAVLVAGTGLYLRAVTDPMDIPGQWLEIREVLAERLAAGGVGPLHDLLVELDPLAASRIDPANDRRIVRALEVTLGAGRPFSSFGAGVAVHPEIAFTMIGLRWPRPLLAERIAVRVQRMVAAGLLDEVARLATRPGGWSRTARQALGYKELLEHLDGAASLDEAVEATITRTRQFAVRQERWFRRDPRIRWVDLHDDPVGEVLGALDEPSAGNRP